MACGSKEAGGAYRPRHPQQSPFYRLVERCAFAYGLGW